MDAYRQHEQDALAVAQNGGASSVDEDDLDDTDGEMDDDMMDRISSSPSIEDGGFSSVIITPPTWPQRISSLPSIPRGHSPSVMHPSPDTHDVPMEAAACSKYHHPRPLPHPPRRMRSIEYDADDDRDDDDDDDYQPNLAGRRRRLFMTSLPDSVGTKSELDTKQALHAMA